MGTPCMECTNISCKWNPSNSWRVKDRFQNQVIKHFFILYGLTFAVILPLCCSNLKYSIYYHGPKTKQIGQDHLMSENTERVKRSLDYIKMVGSSHLHNLLEEMSTQTPDNHQLDVAVGIVSVAREINQYQPQYLTQVVTRFLRLLEEQKTKGTHLTVKLFVCNVDKKPELHMEARNLSRIVTVVDRFKNNARSTAPNIFDKGKQDYSFCISQAIKYNPRYALLLEDDAVPNEHFFDILEHVINGHLKNDMVRDGRTKPDETVLYVKLYHPEWLLGYLQLEPDRLTELFGIGFAFGTIAAILYKHLIGYNLRLSTSQELTSYICIMLYFILVAGAIGRPHLLQLRFLFKPYLTSFMRAPECCTQALLFPNKGAQLVTQYLNSVTCRHGWSKDMALLAMEQENSQYKAYMVQPNLFTHVGIYSSLRHRVIDPYLILT